MPTPVDVTHLPAWVGSLLSADAGVPESGHDGLMVRDSAGLRVVSARIEGAGGLEEPAFSAQVTRAYRSVFTAIRRSPLHSPVRFWNHIPGLHDRMGPGLDRYMAFNAGRFAAMQEWFGGVSEVRRCVATASGIGHHGTDLVIHCLASATPGLPIENPRQVPAYLYSRRFGPTPPCFARATVAQLAGERLLLVAGTASIRGEESVHIGDLTAQVAETLINLRAVIGAAGEGTAQTGALGQMRDVRVYHPRLEDCGELAEVLGREFAGARVEVQRADLCRSELLVEIEGVAMLGSG